MQIKKEMDTAKLRRKWTLQTGLVVGHSAIKPASVVHEGLIQFSLKVMRRKILKDASENWLRTGINKDRNWEKLGKKGKRYRSGKNNTPLLTLFSWGS